MSRGNRRPSWQHAHPIIIKSPQEWSEDVPGTSLFATFCAATESRSAEKREFFENSALRLKREIHQKQNSLLLHLLAPQERTADKPTNFTKSYNQRRNQENYIIYLD